MTSRLQTTLDRHRRQLDRRDRQLSTEMARTYAAVWRNLQDEIARTLGAEAPDVYRMQRLGELVAQAEAEFARWAVWADRRIRTEFPDVVAAAEAHAAQLAAAQAVDAGGSAAGKIVASTWNRINTAALSEIVAATTQPSPVWELFNQLGHRAATTITGGLRQGVAQGWSPRKTAARIRDALGGDLNRALTIARTETLRAYREATRHTYSQNADLVTGWIWTAHPGQRTCAACWAMNGTHHPLDEPLGSHPRCRCTMVPELKPWAEIHPALAGLDELDHPTGAALFAAQPEATQRAVLGPTRYDAYRRGDLTIDQNPHSGVVQERHDPVWGTTRTVRPISRTPALHR